MEKKDRDELSMIATKIIGLVVYAIKTNGLEKTLEDLEKVDAQYYVEKEAEAAKELDMAMGDMSKLYLGMLSTAFNTVISAKLQFNDMTETEAAIAVNDFERRLEDAKGESDNDSV